MNFVFPELTHTDADWVNGKLDVISIVKRDYKKIIEQMNETDIHNDRKKKSTTTVYHGTSSQYLPEILSNGILSRQLTGNSNWSKKGKSGERLHSIPNLIYVTNKLHHYYANMANKEVEQKEIDKEGNYPCYITCEIPNELLVPDEDSFHSNAFWEKYLAYHTSQGKIPLEWSGEESLKHYFTSAVPFSIPLSYIKEITILADKAFMEDLLSEDPSSSYNQALNEWAVNGGVATIKLSPVYKKQSKSLMNKTFKMDKNHPVEKVKKDIIEFQEWLVKENQMKK